MLALLWEGSRQPSPHKHHPDSGPRGVQAHSRGAGCLVPRLNPAITAFACCLHWQPCEFCTRAHCPSRGMAACRLKQANQQFAQTAPSEVTHTAPALAQQYRQGPNDHSSAASSQAHPYQQMCSCCCCCWHLRLTSQLCSTPLQCTVLRSTTCTENRTASCRRCYCHTALPVPTHSSCGRMHLPCCRCSPATAAA